MTGPLRSLEDVKLHLKREFTINFSPMSPGDFDYVGTHVQHDKDDKSFLLSQPGMIEKTIVGIEGEETIPYDQNLFRETDEAKLSDDTKFRSKLMEVAYLGRTRMDIKVPVGYLCTKMQKPTVGDWRKLNKVLKYINATKTIKLRIKPQDVHLRGIADSSHGPYQDGKSNSGIIVTIGHPNAPIIAKSAKQKSVANSSTTAELIAFSSTLEEIMWSKNMMEELGFKQETIVIEQDNTSPMKLIEKGPTSAGRTKWINVKQFWVSEHLQNGTIKLQYVSDLLADGLTKTLGKKNFLEWRAKIQNDVKSK